MKHAYLIMAHNEFEVLQCLVNCLDDVRNTIFIHFDKKIKVVPLIVSKYSELIIIQDRVDVRWGHYSQIKAELNLFKTALSYAEFAYLHLLSGVHLPLYTQDYIHTFFDQSSDNNYLMGMPVSQREIEMKMNRYNFFIKNFMHKNLRLRRLYQLFWNIVIKLQDITGIKRNSVKKFSKASQWVSLTLEAIKYISSQEERILKTYRYTFCSDEFFIKTELEDSPLRNTIVDEKRLLACDFQGTSPKLYLLNDYSDIIRSNKLFARKFSAVHMDVIHKIITNLRG